MNPRLVRLVFMFVVIIAIGMGFGLHSAMAEQDEYAEEGKEGVEVLSHGPVHEAFAETVAFDPQAGPTVTKAPPPTIEEVPPEQKPEGDVKWIPGYWAWEDDRSDYIWVSGVWRLPPPGRQWVPGYWARSGNRYQWTSGYWVTVRATEVEYLPEPPASVELGPNTNAPSTDYTWIPGCWIWHHSRYAWRPGYWAKMQSDWVWVPAHYSWTPRGYIFISGYWDYVVVRRGILYAPVFLAPRVYAGVTFSFSPGFIVDLDVFSDCLFLRPGYRHYYFGDYYAPRYYREGIYPWFSHHARRHSYDPIYAHQRWHHRHDNDWENHLHRRFRDRRDNESIRPSRRPDYGRGQGRDWGKPSRTGTVAATTVYSPVRRSIDSSVRVKTIDAKERSEIRQQEKAVQTYRRDRQERETRDFRETKGTTTPVARSFDTTTPNRVRIDRSPITAKPREQMEPNNAPPSRYSAPKPDPNVEPLRRTSEVTRTRDWGNRGEDRGFGRSKRTDQSSETPRVETPRATSRSERSGSRQSRDSGRN